MSDPSNQSDPIQIKETTDDHHRQSRRQRRERPGPARGARGAVRRAGSGPVHLAGQLHLAQRYPQPLHRGRLHGLGAEQQHRTEYEFDVDHPECFASEDNGATPVEYVLVGLAGCLTAGVASVAQHRGIQLRSVTATIEGEMNVLGILGGDPDVRNGFEAVTVRFAIDADAPRDDLEALIAQSQKRSAVFDIVTNPTKVLVELA